MRINTNMAAQNAWRSTSANQANLQKSLEKLSSGYRINRAADDAAGLAVSEKMRSQIRGLNQAVRNAQDGTGLVQTAEGGAGVIQDMLQRMRELATQAKTGSLQASDRTALDQEYSGLMAEIDNIATRTQFNGQTLLNGSLGSTTSVKVDHTADGVVSVTGTGATAGKYAFALDDTAKTITITDATGNAEVESYTTPTGSDQATIHFATLGFDVVINNLVDADVAAGGGGDDITVTGGSATLQVGANSTDTLAVSIGNFKATGTNLGLNGTSLTSAANANTALGDLDTAISYVSGQRAKLGAYQNRLDSTVTNLQTSSENLQAAESRIRDVDMAAEMANFTKYQVLSQASTAMLAQANQLSQGVLSLLRG